MTNHSPPDPDEGFLQPTKERLPCSLSLYWASDRDETGELMQEQELLAEQAHPTCTPGPGEQASKRTDWLASLGLGEATILATIPNQVMDQLSREDRERLSGLLAQEHHYRQHDGFVASWNAARTHDEIQRLTGAGRPEQAVPTQRPSPGLSRPLRTRTNPADQERER